MAKFPEPPRVSRLHAVSAELTTLTAGTRLYRIYLQGGGHPSAWNDLRWFGPTTARFDHHQLPRGRQRRAILYAALEGITCVAEQFQRRRVIETSIGEPWFVGFDVTRDVTLLDLTGNWPTRAGASTAIHSGIRARARRWSSAIYEAFPSVEGLLYCSSMDANRPALALYERAASAMPTAPVVHRSLADPSMRPMLDVAAERFEYFVR